MQIRTILFPTDFSVTTSHTAAFAADLARKYGARVYILHVIYDITRDSLWHSSRLDTASLYDDVRKSAAEEIDRVASAFFQEGIEVEKAVEVGLPYEGILSFADEKDIDMIVIGRHGRKRLGTVIFGSTVQKVLRRAKCPVLTVRERA